MTTSLCQFPFCAFRYYRNGLVFHLIVLIFVLAGSVDAHGKSPGEGPDLLGFKQRMDEFARNRQDDPLAQSLANEIIRRGDLYINAPLLRYQTVNSLMLDTGRAALGRILSWVGAWRLTKDRRYVEAARRELLNVTSFPEWGPQHFLGVAEMSLAVSVGYSVLYEELSADDRERLREALLTKVLAHAPEIYAPGSVENNKLWQAFGSTDTATNNWNQVCNGGLLAAALALETERPDLTRIVVDGVKQSLPRAMQVYAPDGAWAEGPVYWSYATSYNVVILALLEARYGRDFGLAELPGFSRTAEFMLHIFGPSRRAYNFGDGGMMNSDRPSLQAPAFWLGKRFAQGRVLEQARQRLAIGLANVERSPDTGILGGEDRFLVLNTLWFPFGATTASSAAEKEPPLDRYFRGAAELAVFRSAWNDPGAVSVALKAGTNGFAHGHLDLGSFMLEADGIRWALDLGPDNYRLSGYWDDDAGGKRWTYFRMNNRSHNTLTVGDALQPARARAPIIDFKSDPRFAYAITDLTEAYPGLAQARRGVALIDRKRVLVADELRCATPAKPVSWRMATDAEISLSTDGRVATLKKQGKQLHARLLAPANGRFTICPATPPTDSENQNANVKLLQIDLNPVGSQLSIAVLFVPGPPRDGERSTPAPQPLDRW